MDKSGYLQSEHDPNCEYYDPIYEKCTCGKPQAIVKLLPLNEIVRKPSFRWRLKLRWWELKLRWLRFRKWFHQTNFELINILSQCYDWHDDGCDKCRKLDRSAQSVTWHVAEIRGLPQVRLLPKG